MKRVLALSLAVLFVFLSFTGCEKTAKTDNLNQETIIGDWTFCLSIKDFLFSQLSKSEAEIFALSGGDAMTSTIEIDVNFSENGQFHFDRDPIINLLEDVGSSFNEWLAEKENFYSFFSSVGNLDKTEIDSLIAETGLSFEELSAALSERLIAQIGASIEEMAKTWNNQTISYELKDNAIVLTFDSSDSDKSSQKTLCFEYDGTINVTSVAKNDKDPHSIEQGALVIKRR